jgi:hypothetical protein
MHGLVGTDAVVVSLNLSNFSSELSLFSQCSHMGYRNEFVIYTVNEYHWRLDFPYNGNWAQFVDVKMQFSLQNSRQFRK